jgi:hypothetical protein
MAQLQEVFLPYMAGKNGKPFYESMEERQLMLPGSWTNDRKYFTLGSIPGPCRTLMDYLRRVKAGGVRSTFRRPLEKAFQGTVVGGAAIG